MVLDIDFSNNCKAGFKSGGCKESCASVKFVIDYII